MLIATINPCHCQPEGGYIDEFNQLNVSINRTGTAGEWAKGHLAPSQRSCEDRQEFH